MPRRVIYNMRKESDSIGSIEVPENKYWGAQTERSLQYFSIGDDLIPIEMVFSMGVLKKAAAIVNNRLGLLSKDKSDVMIMASDEVISGKLNDHFPLHVWMTGSGTQFNMNVNEVISNRAIEMVGGKIGSKDPIHPNDHVNMSQSTNDAFPTAMHIAALLGVKNKLIPSLTSLSKMLWQKVEEWKDVIKIGRTHMQDAVPLTLGQEFSGYAFMIDEDIRRIEGSLQYVKQLAIGGTAVGTGLNTHKDFANLMVQEISKITGVNFEMSPNKFASLAAHDALVNLSGALKTLACSLYKIANDIRLLSSGPRAGLCELFLPANEPGSSMMPGKVNPTQCESVTMAAVQVMGYDVAVSMASAGGFLELNVYKPLIIFNIMKSINMLADSCDNFNRFLLVGMRPNVGRMKKYVDDSLMLVTALSPVIGYDKAAQLAHYADSNGCSLREANSHFRFVTDEEMEKILDAKKMI